MVVSVVEIGSDEGIEQVGVYVDDAEGKEVGVMVFSD